MILIGFKSAGKTTLGKKVAEALHRPFIDTDDLFEAPPRELYNKLGEVQFRDLEKLLIRKLQVTGHVIATGGGVPLDPDNQSFLRALGTVIFLNTPKEVITDRQPRFLEQYEERLGIYRSMAHHVIQTESELWEVIRLDPFSA